MTEKPSKFYVRQVLAEWIGRDPGLRILDLGSGRSGLMEKVMAKFPDTNYTGIEPDRRSAAHAASVLGAYPHVRIINDLAYGSRHRELAGKFDVVMSLSALEHIKDLDNFLGLSAACLKPGGRMIHLYDLGHALHPSSIKEKLQVFLCNHLPSLLPENKFASYVDSVRVQAILEAQGIAIGRTTYHNHPGHVKALKNLADDEAGQKVIEKMIDLENQLAPLIPDRYLREKLFPTVCLWGEKK